MAMGNRRQRRRQEVIWMAHHTLARGPSHPFYERLNRLLENNHFDDLVEGLCQRFYAEKQGRPSLAPGTYFRLLLIGYFEGIDSERGIAWRAQDSLALRSFLSIALDESPPDHSTLSRTRRLIDVETHREVFTWVLRILAEQGLLKGERLAIDATTLEANAALRAIVRRETGEGYQEFLQRLAEGSGIKTPTREDLARLDRKRARKGSNEEWEHPHDPDARITKMKDGRTHLAHKAEQAVDVETGAVVAVTVQAADQGDTQTVRETLCEAGRAEGSGAGQGVSGAADKAANLAGRKSPRHQLPVFGWLAYPMRAEATTHVLLGRKSPGCPARSRAAVGTIWGASKLGGPNIKKCLQPRKLSPSRNRFGGKKREADLIDIWGRPMTPEEETGRSTLGSRRG